MLRGNFNDVGGRQIHQDDIRILQDEMLKAIQLQYFGQGAFILQGCQVTGTAGNYAIANGLVYVNSKVMEFSTVTGITSFPKYIVQAADVDQDSFPLELGGSAYKRTLIKAQLDNSVPVSGEFITMSASGGRNYNDILASQFVRLSGNQTVNGQKNFSSDVISNGLNVNTEINSINSTLPNKTNKTITITGSGGLTGGGDLSSNRVLSIADDGVTSSKIADGNVTSAELAGSSVLSSKLGSDLVKVKNPSFTGTANFFTELTVTEANLPGCKVGFWVMVSMPNNYPNTGVLSYRVNGVGINGQNVLRQLQGHYHTNAGSSLTTSTAFEFSWFCPLPPGSTGVFSIGHYVGSGVSASITVWMYI